LRHQALKFLAALLMALLLVWPNAAAAAEVLQVRSARLLQVGDRNRSYVVELACVAVAPAEEDAAIAWLRQELPRSSRVNLRPVGQEEGRLLAHVRRLDRDSDVAQGLIAAGLGSPRPCP
jgi:cell division inhibitor SulA